MMSITNILTISSFEAKVLSRNWFFRIVALIGVGFVTIFNLAVFSLLDSPDSDQLMNGWMLPYTTLVMISVPQVAAIIFLATGLIKKDKKLDTNEVFFVRPITNLDYVFGKALAVFKVFLLLDAALLCIPLIVGLTNPIATVNPLAFVIYPLLTSVPTIIFATGISFLLVTIVRNQPISIVLLIGSAGFLIIYYFDAFSNIQDFLAFRISMFASEITGFVDIEFALWQRGFYFLTGIAFLFLTAFFLDRLASHPHSRKVTATFGIALLAVASIIMIKLVDMRQAPISLRQEMVAVNSRWANVPNADMVKHTIDLQWNGQTLATTSEMLIRNNTDASLDTIFFTLNPGLVVDEVFVNDEHVNAIRELQIAAIVQRVAPGDSLRVRMKYHGRIIEAAAHLEVDQERVESRYEYFVFALWKKYAFQEPGYLLLTNDVAWYPEARIGFNRTSPGVGRKGFIQFELSVTVPEGQTAISQGALTITGNTYHFRPEHPLPQISLIAGTYEKKEISVDSITYSVLYYPDHDIFSKHLGLLADTLSYLITDVVNEYEDAQQLSYPFSRLQFVEVPIHFTAYNKIYENHQAYLQPEMVFWPEEGGQIRQFDFRRQLRDMDRQAARANQALTAKQKQANVFNDLLKKVFTKQIGTTWVWDGLKTDEPDYSIFPIYYDFNSGVVSQQWPLLNRSIATYLRDDKQKRNDYSRSINGISFTEECNSLMRKSAMNEILINAPFNKLQKSVALKSEYLFAYLGHLIGEARFKSFLTDWVNSHQHELVSYAAFRKEVFSAFNVDIDPIIRKVYSETSQPAFEIQDVQKYEIMDGDRKRYQVLIKAKNSGESDGLIQVKFNQAQAEDDDYYYAKVNEEVVEEDPGQLSLIKQGETRLLGFVLDEKPNTVAINTLVSKNIPSVIDVSLSALPKPERQILFEGERIVDDTGPNGQEIIVDNEDEGFTTFSPISPTMLRAYLDSRNPPDRKYYGNWSGAYSQWYPTTDSDFYGRVIRSAHFTRSGNGEKIATWSPQLEEDGFYDLYVYMRGKNQNEYVGRNDNTQYNYHYIVNNADGTDVINFNITNAEPGWNYLGSYYFTKTGGSITLTDDCELRNVYADAVKWVKQ